MKTTIAALVSVFVICTPAFASVQNIKINGSIEERAIYINNYDLKNKSLESTYFGVYSANNQDGGAAIDSDSANFILSTVRVGIDSDLTDNVSASIELANQSQWGDTFNILPNGISLNRASITLKEFFYEPLTLKIGRQDLIFGRGFIVGPGLLRDPNGIFPIPVDNGTYSYPDLLLVVAGRPISGALARQYSIFNYYDAIRATLDLDPWTIDVIYSKILQTGTAHDDEDLAGVNIAYRFDSYNAKMEGYYFYDNDDIFLSDLGYGRNITVVFNGFTGLNLDGDTTVPGVGRRVYEKNLVHTIGMRGDIEPLENLSLSGEGAFQFGNLADETGPWNESTNGSLLERCRRAWALDLEGNYTWEKAAYKPNLGLGYVFFSGEKPDNTGDFTAWDPMFRGKFFSAIRDFQQGTQGDFRQSNIYMTKDEHDSAGSTNSHILFLDAGIKPISDLSLKARYLHFWFAEPPVAGRSREAGDELDTVLGYDFTEDVQFELTGAVFFPGRYYDQEADSNLKSNNTAIMITSAVKVRF